MTEPGRRERKKLETRRALVEQALRLATELGPDKVTVEAIADAADVSVRTFFNYFSSKEEAMVGVDPAAVDELRAALLARPLGEAPLDSLRAVLVPDAVALASAADRMGVRAELVRAHPSLMPRHLEGFAHIERALVEAFAERAGFDPDTDLEPALVVGSAVVAVRVAMAHWGATGRVRSIDDLLDQAFALLASGLQARASV